MNWIQRIFGSGTNTSSKTKLMKLKKIAAITHGDPAAFGRAIRGLGYTCVQQTQWGSLIFEKGDCRVIVSATAFNIQNMQFRSEREGVTHELVREGVLVG